MHLQTNAKAMEVCFSVFTIYRYVHALFLPACDKVTAFIGVWTCRKLFPRQTLLIFYEAIVQSKLNIVEVTVGLK